MGECDETVLLPDNLGFSTHIMERIKERREEERKRRESVINKEQRQ
jgi:hypothetical protein